MTGQTNDQFRYQDRHYSVVTTTAGEPFDPRSLGMKPEPVRTDCWRGYQVTYGLSGNRLVVIRLGVNLVVDTIDYQRVEGPSIDTVTPEQSTGEFNNHYIGLRIPLAYSGRLFLAAHFIEEFFEDVAFQQGWKYRELRGLEFVRGVLIDTLDLSEQAAEIRTVAARRNAAFRTFWDRFRAARKAGRKNLAEELRIKHAERAKNPPPGEDYDVQISELEERVFGPGFHDE